MVPLWTQSYRRPGGNWASHSCRATARPSARPLVSCQRATDTSIGSVGRALPGITVKLRDDSELMVRGPNVTSGYWQDAQATSEVVHDGWYATGDLARIDDNGEIRLLGRKREMITLPSGLNVFPADIDAELQREAALVDAATVSWSSDGSAAVYAVVIPRPDVDPAQSAGQFDRRMPGWRRINRLPAGRSGPSPSFHSRPRARYVAARSSRGSKDPTKRSRIRWTKPIPGHHHYSGCSH